MTQALIERLVGQRTRLAQEPVATWHTAEDQELAAYLDLSRRLDTLTALLSTLLPRGWLLVGLLGLAPAFVSGHSAPGLVAVSLGGVLGLRRLPAPGRRAGASDRGWPGLAAGCPAV